MLRRFSINFALFSIFLDIVIVTSSLWFSAWLRPLMNQLPGIEIIASPVVLPYLLYIVFPGIWLIVYLALSIYDGRRYLRVVDEFAMLSLAVAIASVSAAGVLYFSYRDVSRAQFLVFVVIVYIIHLLWRVLARSYFRTQTMFLDQPRRVLVVGAGSLGQKVREQMLSIQAPSLEFIGFVDDVSITSPDINLLGLSEDVHRLISDYSISDVVIALPHSQYPQMSDIVQKLDRLPVRVWVALGFFDLALYKTAIEELAGIPVLDLRASAIDDYQRMVKRAFDIILSLLFLLPALPLMAICSLFIYLEDGFPVLFRQQRVGENGKVFNMLKFRTMIKNAEALRSQVEKRDINGDIIHKTKDDPRVTHIGRFLRRFSLDELPQFINVVRGEMSLVGPRPELPYLVEKYQPWQRKRFAIPPGITGWWQVNGRSDKPMHLHTEDDLYYITNYSLWLDIMILMRTVWVIFVGKGAY